MIFTLVLVLPQNDIYKSTATEYKSHRIYLLPQNDISTATEWYLH